MSKEKQVVTVNGETVSISKCRKFDLGWYKIGNNSIEFSGDCYLIDKKYYRAETGNVVYNYSKKEYVLKNDSLSRGVVATNQDDLILGYFDYNHNSPVIVNEFGSKYHLFDESVIKNNKYYREELSSGVFYHIKRLRADKFNVIKMPKQEYKNSLPYDSKGITDSYMSAYEKYCNPEINSTIKKYSNVFKDLTFGLEFETTKGFMPDRVLNKIGLIPLRDGSISGIEYVTIPLSGEKGLQCVVDATKELKKRTEYNNSCSMHLHIGNVPRTKEFILAFFKLTCALQDEIYTMFPLYKKYNFKVKNKNYSKPYPAFELLTQMDSRITDVNIDENFNVLFYYLSEGANFKDYNNDLAHVHSHHKDPNGNQKWNIKTRYFIHNMIPLIFGNKQTVEFRIHTPTYEVNKILPYMTICSIITSFAIKEQRNILQTKGFLKNMSLPKIISSYLHKNMLDEDGMLSESLIDYINCRKEYTEQDNCNGSIIGNEENIPVSRYVDWEGKSQNKNIFKKKVNMSAVYEDLAVEASPLLKGQSELLMRKYITNIYNNFESKTISQDQAIADLATAESLFGKDKVDAIKDSLKKEDSKWC